MLVFTPTVDEMEMFMNFIGMNLAFSFGSDAAAQILVEGKPPMGIDFKRAGKFAGTGVVFCGVAQFARLRVIETVVHQGEGVMGALQKTAINQMVFSPIIRLSSMASLVFMNTGCWEEVKRKIAADFVEAQSISYLVKPASNLLAFAVFPHQIFMQAVTIRSAAFVYNVYYSHISHKASLGTETTDAVEVKVEMETMESDDAHPVSQLMQEAESVDSSDEGTTHIVPPVSELKDLRVMLQARRLRRAEMETRRKRLARARAMQEQLAQTKQDGRSCAWFRNVTIGLLGWR
eukprot:TRINITY_DN649_c2_g1_i1.p1 TRINITY_DN649_c2_g1~~TRINITY_DN649_c2_g1_i1.p1  ORF type:complete len:290 (+),score=59.49 TRINITY_DN649_c2_g1_i1:46-915(+)